MTDAVFYDGKSARKRTVSLKITASSLDIHEGEEWIASWPVGAVRQKEAQEGVLRLTCEGGPELARLDVTDPDDQVAIRAQCLRLHEGVRKDPVGRIVFWSAMAAVSVAVSVLVLIPLLADRLTPLIPVSVEKRLGKAVDNQLRLAFRGKICTGPAGVSALNALMERLESALPGVEVDVAILDSSVPNAVALPGGRIYLFRALLDKAQSVDEVAGVLAHEMGHAAHRDGLRKLIQSSGTSYLLGLLFGDVTGGGAVVFASRYLLESAYSRETEAAADEVAAQVMTALGRPAHPMARLLRRIEGSEGGGRIPAFLSTHPLTEDRLKAMERHVPPQERPPLLSEEQWRALKDICKTS